MTDTLQKVLAKSFLHEFASKLDVDIIGEQNQKPTADANKKDASPARVPGSESELPPKRDVMKTKTQSSFKRSEPAESSYTPSKKDATKSLAATIKSSKSRAAP
jgi:hypothetical protein